VERSMSHQLDDWAVTNQKKSGRCWMFAGLNLLRVGAAAKLGVKDFEFSQSYLQFWDRLEKADFWLEPVLATATETEDSAFVRVLLLPPEFAGKRTIRHVDPADDHRPRLQRATVFLESPIRL